MKLLTTLLPLAALASSYEVQHPLKSNPSSPFRLDAIPLLGFGTWNLKTNCSQAVSQAIQSGYRHIDCAAAYGNEGDVGAGIADGLRKTGLTREDLWITSKLWNDHHEPARVEKGLNETLVKLGVGYLDLYHMHWPVGSDEGKNKISYLHTWDAMVNLTKVGRVRHLGVCNFDYEQLERLVEHTAYPPAVHQMELHPYLSQPDFVHYHKKHNIHVTAYSPLAGTNPTYHRHSSTEDIEDTFSSSNEDLDAEKKKKKHHRLHHPPPPLLNNTIITSIASNRSCTPAQVALMWGMARGTSVIPKTSHYERIVENLHSLECVLEKKDLEAIDELDDYHWRFNNPAASWKVPLYEGLEDGEGRHKKHS